MSRSAPSANVADGGGDGGPRSMAIRSGTVATVLDLPAETQNNALTSEGDLPQAKVTVPTLNEPAPAMASLSFGPQASMRPPCSRRTWPKGSRKV
jgi:hypothetical protein